MIKKLYAILIVIGMIALAIVSWIVVSDNQRKGGIEFQNHLNLAREYSKNGVIASAENEYSIALKMQHVDWLGEEFANFEKNSNPQSLRSLLKKFLDEFPKSAWVYEMTLDDAVATGDYKTAFSTYDLAVHEGINNDKIEEIYKQFEFAFSTSTVRIEEGGNFTPDGSATVKVDSGYKFIDQDGKLSMDDPLYLAHGFYSSVAAVVKSKDENAVFVDENGQEKYVAKNLNYSDLGSIHLGIFPAFNSLKNKWTFLKTDFTQAFEDGQAGGGDFENVTSLVGGVGGVFQNGKWTIIDDKGNLVAKEIFTDLKMNEFYDLGYNGFFFGKTDSNSKWFLYDKAAKKVECQDFKDGFDDALPFSMNGAAAVKIDEEWGFINQNGTTAISPKFENARSFANGVAAAKTNGKWGYIRENGEFSITAQFDDAFSFNSNGKAIVKTINGFEVLKLKRFN